MVAYSTIGAITSARNEIFIVGVDVRVGDVGRSSTPIVGVILPDDGAKTKCMGNGTHTVINITKGRLSKRVSADTRVKQEPTYTPTGGGDVEHQLDNLHLQGVSKEQSDREVRIQLQRDES